MLIATDIDGVLADFAAGWVERYNREFRAELDLASLTAWDAIVTATDFATAGSFFDWLARVDGFWQGLAPVPGAVEAVHRLRRGGHRLVAVTQRPASARVQTEAWLGDNFAGMKVHLVHDKSAVPADIVVDDSPEVLRQLAGADSVLVRFARPWNEGAPGIAARCWADVVGIVDRLAPGQASRTSAVTAAATATITMNGARSTSATTAAASPAARASTTRL